jgi:hypothetical protein
MFTSILVYVYEKFSTKFYSQKCIEKIIQGYIYALQRRNTENFETNIPRRGIVRHQSHFHIHVSVSNLYIPTIGLPILLQKICGPIL